MKLKEKLLTTQFRFGFELEGYVEDSYFEWERFSESFWGDDVSFGTDSSLHGGDCPDCGGEGLANYTCDDCYGTGSVSCSECEQTGQVDCSHCEGTGKKEDKCHTCYGDGTVKNEEGEDEECCDCSGTGLIEIDCDECAGSGVIGCGICYGSGVEDCNTCGGNGEITETCNRCDGEGHIATPFEFAIGGKSGMPFNPQTIMKAVEYLRDMPTYGVFTDDDCGFHTHLSYEGMTSEQACWVICKLSIDTEMKNRLKYFYGDTDRFEFFDSQHASDNFLTQMEENIKNAYYIGIRRLLSNDKYRTIRIHPQGTLEWRGPRDFMNERETENIIAYFKMLWGFVAWIRETLDSNTIEVEGAMVDRKEFFKRANVYKLLFEKEGKTYSNVFKMFEKKRYVLPREFLEKEGVNFIDAFYDRIAKAGFWSSKKELLDSFVKFYKSSDVPQEVKDYIYSVDLDIYLKYFESAEVSWFRKIRDRDVKLYECHIASTIKDPIEGMVLDSNKEFITYYKNFTYLMDGYYYIYDSKDTKLKLYSYNKLVDDNINNATFSLGNYGFAIETKHNSTYIVYRNESETYIKEFDEVRTSGLHGVRFYIVKVDGKYGIWDCVAKDYKVPPKYYNIQKTYAGYKAQLFTDETNYTTIDLSQD